MPIHKDISFSSTEFQALVSNDSSFVRDNFHLYEPLKDYWLTVASCFSNLEMNELIFSRGANIETFGVEHFFNDFLKLIFSKPFKSHFENLNKIYSYYKLDLLMADKFKSKIQKI